MVSALTLLEKSTGANAIWGGKAQLAKIAKCWTDVWLSTRLILHQMEGEMDAKLLMTLVSLLKYQTHANVPRIGLGSFVNSQSA